MFRLAICEDEDIIAEAHKELVRAILENLGLEYQISVFKNGADFLASFYGHAQRYDMMLLDIVLDGADGIDGLTLARRVRREDEDVAIVFVTANKRYALKGYDVEPLHYLIKPVSPQKLEELIKRVIYRQNRDKVLLIKSGENNVRVPIKNIVSLEITGRRIEVTLTDGTAYYPGKFTDILNELPKDIFVRCHQSYAVNIKNVREFTRQNVVTVNGKMIPVSRTYWSSLRAAFVQNVNA